MLSENPPPVLRRIRNRLGKIKDRATNWWQVKYIPADKLLMGGEQGIRPAKYAELAGDFFRPSTLFSQGVYCKFLEQYREQGRAILESDKFRQTGYYQNALQCISIYGIYERFQESDLPGVAERFIKSYEQIRAQPRPDQAHPPVDPIIVLPVKYSSHYAVMEGNRGAAAAIVAGATHIPALIPDPDPTLTPLQQLLLDVQWTESKNALYQPVDSPEIREQWKPIRKSTDRLQFMVDFLRQTNLLPQPAGSKSYLDLGSSYGWFVHQFGQLGFQASGVERDPVAIQVGQRAYGLAPGQLTRNDIIEYLNRETRAYDVVTLLSVLHHFVRGNNCCPPEELIRLVDKITKQVLFFDTGQEHEPAFNGRLRGWSPAFIQDWILKNTSFQRVVPLGIDGDAASTNGRYYGRTLFACVKDRP